MDAAGVDSTTITESTRWIAQLGIGGTIAIVIFVFYRRDMRSYSELWQAQATETRAMTDRVITLVETTTKTATELTAVVTALHRRLDGRPER
jgi:hypothetical protein